MTEHQQRTINFYAHDYRGMAMSEDSLKDMLTGMVESLDCVHTHTSSCRKNGCNCDCGEYHFS